MHRFSLALPPLLALAVVFAAACGGGGGTASEAQPPFGLTERPSLDPALSFPTGVPASGEVALVRAFSRLSFSRPVLLTAASDGSDWVYVVEQAGRVLVFDNDDDVETAATFLDIRDLVSRSGNEEGLIGLAFDPDFGRDSGDVWVHYSASNPRRGVLARYAATFPTDGPPVVSGAGAVILEVPQPYSNHNGGMLAFGPDDMLYMGLGDGGSGDDPQRNGQDLSTLLATILRLDVRAKTTYTVPADNPFVGVAGARSEIWAYGLRNPWRFHFDPDTGDLWVGDVGQGAREEVGVVRRGENHGWPIYEGTRSHLNPLGLPAEDFTGPVRDYPRSEGTCVIGGAVYRGALVPSLRGAYVYGDYGNGGIQALRREGDLVASNVAVATLSQLSSFGTDGAGELYAVSLGGPIHRFVETGGGGAGTFPTLLSETGLFTDTANLTPNPGLIPFDVNAPLWSDATTKQRWLALPTGAQVGFDAEYAWTFPRGTVLVKHFELELRVGDPSSRRRLETRVLLHESEGWRGYAYRWNAAQTDAELLLGADTLTLTIEDPEAPDGTRTQRYDIPSRTDCLRCHTAAAGVVLGPRTAQLNRTFDYGGVVDNQLRAWNHVALFDRDVGAATAYEALADPYDEALEEAPRARAYLEANCAYCHLPGGPAPGDLDLRAGTPTAGMHAVDERPTEGNLGLPDAWRVRPGDRSNSVLWERMRRRGPHQMPPLATSEVDERAVDLLGRWIDALP